MKTISVVLMMLFIASNCMAESEDDIIFCDTIDCMKNRIAILSKLSSREVLTPETQRNMLKILSHGAMDAYVLRIQLDDLNERFTTYNKYNMAMIKYLMAKADMLESHSMINDIRIVTTRAQQVDPNISEEKLTEYFEQEEVLQKILKDKTLDYEIAKRELERLRESVMSKNK
jgi:hypothetical protein